MKKILITCAMLAVIVNVKGQSTGMDHGKWEENSRGKVHIQQDNEFANTEIAVESKLITFSDLPELNKATWAIITDANGEVITQKRVTPQSNTMSIRSLSRGELYYLTLIYRNKSKKAFVLHP